MLCPFVLLLDALAKKKTSLEKFKALIPLGQAKSGIYATIRIPAA